MVEQTKNLWSHLELPPIDPIFGTYGNYQADQDPNKISIVLGVYRDENMQPIVFDCVRAIEEDIVKDKLLKEYLTIDGDSKFNQASKEFVFGKDSPDLDRIATLQTISCTGALRVGAEFLKKFLPEMPKVYFSKETWANHKKVFRDTGFVDHAEYPYCNHETMDLDIDGMLSALKEAPKGSIIVLQMCGHNPTGIDPSKEQWKLIIEVIKNNSLIPFVDNTYMGWSMDNFDEEAYPIREMVKNNIQLLCGQSFSKCAGLYGDRIGALHVFCQDSQTAKIVGAQIKIIIRGIYSNPPIHGAEIVTRLLTTPKYFEQWKEELKEKRGRIEKVRKELSEELAALGTPGKWDHFPKQRGWFSQSGLNYEQCKMLTEKYHVYMLTDGKMSLTFLNSKNIKLLAKCINEVVLATKK